MTREELIARQQKELRKFDIKTKLTADLIERAGKEPDMIHIHPLYGRAGSIVYKVEATEFWTWVKRYAKEFLPESLTFVRDSGVSIRTTAHVEALAEKERERFESEYEVSPFWMEVDAGGGYPGKVEVSWATRIGDEVWEMTVEAKYPNCVPGVEVGATMARVIGRTAYRDRMLKLDLPIVKRAEPETFKMWVPEDHCGKFKVVWHRVGAEMPTAYDLAEAELEEE